MHTQTILSSSILFSLLSHLHAVDVTDGASLNAALQSGATTITFQNTINLTAPALTVPILFPINSNNDFSPRNQTTTINAAGFTLDGGGTFHGFFVRGGTARINNLTFNNTHARGGDGGIGGPGGSGGGGGGFGGALYVASGATATLINPTFTNSSAQGGNGGSTQQGENVGKGGGGFLGNGGQAGGGFIFDGGFGNSGEGTGGGGGGTGGSGVFPINPGEGGAGGPDFGGSPGGAGGASSGGNGGIGPSGTGGGGGGSSDVAAGGNGGQGGYGGGGGSGGSGNPDGVGGQGGHFGGGGSGGVHSGGNGGAGGFCGGGGGGGFADTEGASGGNGAIGGFGGGGGGGASSAFGSGGSGGIAGFGAGNGAPFGGPIPNTFGDGGGGAGFGGAIFIENGGIVNILQSAFFENNTASAGLAGTFGTGATNGTFAGLDIFMMSGGQLNVNNTININIPNPIEGDQGAGGGPTAQLGPAGGLTKAGCARLTLNGANTYTGLTEVLEGELRINGSIVTDVIVSENAILSGNFSILRNLPLTNNGDLTNNGIISPGVDGIGQISIAGDFVNNPTGTILADITPSPLAHDSIAVSGNTTLNGGILDVVVNAGNYIQGTAYTIIDGPVTGTFDQIIQSGVNAGLIDIGISYSSVVVTVLENHIFKNQVIDKGVPQKVANCIINADIEPHSDFANIVELLGFINDKDLNEALYNMSPVNYGALEWINSRNNNYLANLLSMHLFRLRCNPRGDHVAYWASPLVNVMNNDKRYNNLSPFRATAYGAATGADYYFNNHYTAGGAMAYTHTDLKWKQGHGDGSINTYYGALYGSYASRSINVDLSIIGGTSDHNLKRKTKIEGTFIRTIVDTSLCDDFQGVKHIPINVGVSRSARSNPWGYFFTGHVGLSSDRHYGRTTFTPYALVNYNYFNRKRIKEHGAESLNLLVQKHHQNIIRSEVGLNSNYTWDFDHYCFAPYLGISWVGEFPLHKSVQSAHFEDSRCIMHVRSYHSPVNLVSPQAGLKWTRHTGYSFQIAYKGLFNSRTSINEASARLEWDF